MIRALLVDDEMITRKGLIQTLPWGKYGFQIVAEAGSAMHALEYLEHHPVDLLLTDITMPNMSGFDLMGEVIAKYPGVRIVVITCHQDFDFIQKALRMGAIDYIVKTQIDNEELEESLKRIALRMEKGNLPEPSRVPPTGGHDLVAVPRWRAADAYKHPLPGCLNGEKGSELPGYCLYYRLEEQKLPQLREAFAAQGEDGAWLLVELENCRQMGWEKLAGFVSNYIGRVLFYEFDGAHWCFSADAADENRPMMDNEPSEGFLQLKKEWQSVVWISDDKKFEQLRQMTKDIRPEIPMLKGMLYQTVSEWESYFCLMIPNESYEKLETASFWVDYIRWLAGIRGFILSRINSAKMPGEMVRIVLNSLEYVKSNLTKEISQAYLADINHISRGYFSKIFKEIIGESFIDYMKHLRIEKAKKLLTQSSMPIYEIAEQVGFLDEKYFSRVFKESTEMTPMDFRSRMSRA